jgi:hypothetical protein
VLTCLYFTILDLTHSPTKTQPSQFPTLPEILAAAVPQVNLSPVPPCPISKGAVLFALSRSYWVRSEAVHLFRGERRVVAGNALAQSAAPCRTVRCGDCTPQPVLYLQPYTQRDVRPRRMQLRSC